jgi:hypothetical protein
MKHSQKLLLFVLILLLIIQSSRLSSQMRIPLDDFLAYWSAARLLMEGQDPYSLANLGAKQREVGWTEPPLVMLYPPWTFPLLLPFALFSYQLSRLLWLSLQMTALLLGAACIWKTYGGSGRLIWLSSIFALFFFPASYTLRVGQIDCLVLLGLAGFFFFENRNNDVATSLCCVLIALKPHPVYLFWIALAIWAVHQRRWKLLFAGGLIGIFSTIALLALNPHLVTEYLRACFHHPPTYWKTPTIAAWLRSFIDSGSSWPLMLPSVVGFCWYLALWHRNRRSWEWREQLPLLLLASALTSPYSWSFDMSLLLLPLIQTLVWVSKARMILISTVYGLAYIVLNAFAYWLNWKEVNEFAYIWVAPASLFGYLAVRHFVLDSESPIAAQCRSA